MHNDSYRKNKKKKITKFELLKKTLRVLPLAGTYEIHSLNTHLF